MRLAALVIGCLAFSSSSKAASLWISDLSGNIGLVNLGTGAVTDLHNTGQILTDIAFVGNNMYGTTFSGLYSVNTATGNVNLIGNYGLRSMDALVGNGSGLLGASYANRNVYSISPSSAALSPFATAPGVSAGDLAFAGGTLYEAGVNANGINELYNVTSGQLVANLTLNGTPQTGVYGLADDGTTMYATEGRQIYTVNLTTGAMSFTADYSSSNLGEAIGAAFVSENVSPVPLPPALPMFAAGLVALSVIGFLTRKRDRLAVPA